MATYITLMNFTDWNEPGCAIYPVRREQRRVASVWIHHELRGRHSIRPITGNGQRDAGGA